MNGLDGPVAFALGWDVIDEACVTIDPGRLRLLLAEDRLNSSVAGVAPEAATVVRLLWRNGDVTDVPVADDEVPAFVDASRHSPDRLVLAEALDDQGRVLATARPSAARPRP